MKNRINVVMSWFMLIGHIITIFMGYGILIFIYTYPPARHQITVGDGESIFVQIMLIICMGVFPTLLIILAIPRGIFSVVTISDKGVRRTLFVGLLKREITWEEMTEMRYYSSILPFVFFSKTTCLDGLAYEKMYRKNDVIQVALSKKVYNAIRRFTDKEIIDLPEKMKIGLDS